MFPNVQKPFACTFRYPSTLDEFYQSRLPGTFDEERAGKRMKLPTPETWETQVSMKGNKASTWESLIGKDELGICFLQFLTHTSGLQRANACADLWCCGFRPQEAAFHGDAEELEEHD